MARNGIKNTTMLLIKPFSVQEITIRRPMSKLARQNDHRTKTDEAPEDRRSCWIPHPRTGIYFPMGQEWVMEDVPNDAASFDCTFWLRSIDGVEDKDKLGTNNVMHHNPNRNTNR
ncbi:hypothetical protein PHJA_002284600 [Phtheirospermum japonicum]|uniref:Uncharacterized protein n=1 Tax=Phtheirospermum japonicum TaxID=374723 RepID=A0A830CQ21_9LAMI|nr:hypothetical protein PHJA_002284600 [Phtheirospermum japonicum]